MKIFGIGAFEIFLIIFLMLLLLGPKEMISASRKMGRLIRQVRRSGLWQEINTIAGYFRNLPDYLAEQAKLDELEADLEETSPKNAGAE